MILFPSGISITEAEYKSLLHVEADPEQWLVDAVREKAQARREALINEWRPRLFADPTVTTLPADAVALAQLIMARPDYQSRAQADANAGETPYLHNIARFAGLRPRGSERIGDLAGPTVTLVPTGIDISDLDRDCILAYVQDLDDWVLGALLGHINRGKKKMIRQYQPVLMADPDVATIPANEDELIEVITARADYKPLSSAHAVAP